MLRDLDGHHHEPQRQLGRFAGVDRLTPRVPEPVEMPLPFVRQDTATAVTVSEPLPQSGSSNEGTPLTISEIRLARVWLGAFTAIGTIGTYIQFQAEHENWPATLATTVVSGLATIGSLRIRS